MRAFPENLTFHRRTPDFEHNSVPPGILGQHRISEDVWGKVMVSEGNLTYRILEPNIEEYIIDTENFGVVAPQAAHQVEINGPVKFHIEFYHVKGK